MNNNHNTPTKRQLLALVEDAVKAENFAERIKRMSELHKEFGSGDVFKLLGRGSARHVYDLGNGEVIKLATNIKGLAQNQQEMTPCMSPYDTLNQTDIENSDNLDFCIYEKRGRFYMVDSDNGVVRPQFVTANRFLVANKAERLTEKKFEEVSGMKFKQFADLINGLHKYLESSTGSYPSDGVNQLSENQIGAEMVEFINDYYGHYPSGGDFSRVSSYGLVDGEIKLIDYGANREVMRELYYANNGAAQKAMNMY